jgi:3-hydroxybutyrate dehydrogenase
VPWLTETDLLLESMAEIERKTGKSAADVRTGFARSNPQGRLVLPAEVAAAVLFLCGPGSEAMNGLALPVAGGEVM